MSRQLISSLPRDILFDIFLRLPSKPLLRSTAVCKPWRDLIKDPEFIAKHLEKSASESDGYILCLYDKPRPNKNFDIICENTCKHVKQIEIPEQAGPLNCVIVGSFNGVVCLCDTEECGTTVRICNPSIGKYRVIRSTSLDVPLETLDHHDTWLGFGFQDETNDYKVVRIVYLPKENSSTAEAGSDSAGDEDDVNVFYENGDVYDLDVNVDHDNGVDCDFNINVYQENGHDDKNEIQNIDFIEDTEVEVYSTRRNAWERVHPGDTFPWQILETASGLMVKGSIHWLACHCYPGHDQLVILSFHLGLQTFREISLPNNHAGIDQKESLGLFEGRLAFFDTCPIAITQAECCNLWVMNEYGVESSWNLLYICVIAGGVERPRFFSTRQRKIIIEGPGGKLFAFNLNTNEVENLELEDSGADLTFAPFTPSIVWPQD